jgi:hypothetical protein
MTYVFFIPFLVQAIAIGFDEVYYHIRRGLPRWERIGHPLDTLSVCACLFFAWFFPFTTLNMKIYIALAIFSCLMVTKDEFVHKHHCPVGEHWLHALLFINHPLMLTSAGLMWAAGAKEAAPNWLLSYVTQPEIFSPFLLGQASFALFFFFYQTIYWNFIWQEK